MNCHGLVRTLRNKNTHMPKEDKRSNGRKNAPVGSDWLQPQLHQLWNKHKNKYTLVSNSDEPIPFSACHVWSGDGANRGYPTISLGHAKSKMKVHILAYANAHGCFTTSDEVVSHLCHRKRCFNVQHLRIESITMK